MSTLRFGRCKTNIHWMFCTSYLACPKFKSLIVQARTAFWPFDTGIIWCWGQKVFCPQLMPTNCSAAKQLPQFYKHSKSADLLRKSLLSHVWRVPSSKALSCKHERLFDLLTLASCIYRIHCFGEDEEHNPIFKSGCFLLTYADFLARHHYMNA